jgi:hypothetical protein
MPISDLARDIHGRAAELHTQTKCFRLWELFGLKVDKSREFHGFLPNMQIAKDSRSRHVR